jgi:predicted DNA-binding transcriptional regulator AlpA
MNMPEMLTAKDVCRILAITRRTLRKWILSNLFPKPIQIRRLQRWEQRELELWKEAHRGR